MKPCETVSQLSTVAINGWDLQKALRLLHSSNPTLFEWNNSPIVYKTTPEWAEISSIIGHFFQKKAGLYHYLSTAKKNYREYLKGDMVKLKKYFYVLRPILACRWILEKQTPPPMLFSTLADACLDEALVPAVTDLLRLKMETPENWPWPSYRHYQRLSGRLYRGGRPADPGNSRR